MGTRTVRTETRKACKLCVCRSQALPPSSLLRALASAASLSGLFLRDGGRSLQAHRLQAVTSRPPPPSPTRQCSRRPALRTSDARTLGKACLRHNLYTRSATYEGDACTLSSARDVTPLLSSASCSCLSPSCREARARHTNAAWAWRSLSGSVAGFLFLLRASSWERAREKEDGAMGIPGKAFGLKRRQHTASGCGRPSVACEICCTSGRKEHTFFFLFFRYRTLHIVLPICPFAPLPICPFAPFFSSSPRSCCLNCRFRLRSFVSFVGFSSRQDTHFTANIPGTGTSPASPAEMLRSKKKGAAVAPSFKPPYRSIALALSGLSLGLLALPRSTLPVTVSSVAAVFPSCGSISRGSQNRKKWPWTGWRSRRWVAGTWLLAVWRGAGTVPFVARSLSDVASLYVVFAFSFAWSLPCTHPVLSLSCVARAAACENVRSSSLTAASKHENVGERGEKAPRFYAVSLVFVFLRCALSLHPSCEPTPLHVCMALRLWRKMQA